MNKKKIATLLLVGTLLVGGGALGAKAWFTSNANVKTNLKVTMGTLNLEAQDNVWRVLNSEAFGQDGLPNNNPDMVTEITNSSADNNYVNVRPGDDFIKEVAVRNTGTLKSRTTFKINDSHMPDHLRDKVIITIKDIDSGETLTNQERIMEPTGVNGDTKNIQITVKLDGEKIKNEYQGKIKGDTIGSLHKELVDFLNSGTAFIDVSGTQVNATTPQQ